VNDGGGLLFTLGDQVDADLYNSMFGKLLPRELRGVLVPYAGAQGASEIRVMHLETQGLDAEVHPLLSVFREAGQGDLGLSGFKKYFVVQQEAAPTTKVILRLTDGSPMMVEGRYGKGKVILFASTADRAWNDLCIHPTFLPLFQQTVQYLADALLMEDAGKMVAGSIAEVPAPPDIIGASIVGPDGSRLAGEVVEEGGVKRIRIGRAELPGVYYLKLQRPGEARNASFDAREADRTLVINVDPEESDLTRLDQDEIKARTGAKEVKVVGAGARLDSESAAGRESKSYAWLLLWGVIGLAVLERALTRKG